MGKKQPRNTSELKVEGRIVIDRTADSFNVGILDNIADGCHDLPADSGIAPGVSYSRRRYFGVQKMQTFMNGLCPRNDAQRIPRIRKDIPRPAKIFRRLLQSLRIVVKISRRRVHHDVSSIGKSLVLINEKETNQFIFRKCLGKVLLQTPVVVALKLLQYFRRITSVHPDHSVLSFFLRFS